MRTLCIIALFLVTLSNAGFAQNTPKPGVEVVLSRTNPLHLRVTPTSGAASTATIYHADFPWGIRDSMVFAIARPNGEPIDLEFPVDDPGPAKVSIKPSET